MILNSAWLNAVGMGGFSARAVSPGDIDTPIFELEGATPEQLVETKRQMSLRILARHMGEPFEVAQAVLFLASDESHCMPGAENLVVGGFAQR